MNETLLNILQYYGAAAATLAALVVSLNLGRRITGWAFLLFVTSSVALILWGFLAEDSKGIGFQNVALLVINAIGVWRHLFSNHGASKHGARRDRHSEIQTSTDTACWQSASRIGSSSTAPPAKARS